MDTPHDLRSIMDAAERAAASGDFAGAERGLREGLSLQEAALGPHHPDLANTLNNLGVVCEMIDNPREAEQCYRRAYAIVSASLPPDHPSVVTSRKNLEDFCHARQIPVNPPAAMESRPSPAPIAAAAPASIPAAAPVPIPAAAPAPTMRPSPAPVPRVAPSAVVVRHNRPKQLPVTQPSRMKLAGLVIVAGVMLIAVLSYLVPNTNEPEPSSVAPGASPAADAPDAPPTSPAPPAPPAPPALDASPASPAPKGPPAPRATRARAPQVLTAEICRTLSTTGTNWQCERVSGGLAPGRVTFYTRVASSVDTSVEHRWYRGDRLHQRVELQVRANAAGYRTYSRYTITADRAGSWRVELRDSEGRVLEEKSFIVK